MAELMSLEDDDGIGSHKTAKPELAARHDPALYGYDRHTNRMHSIHDPHQQYAYPGIPKQVANQLASVARTQFKGLPRFDYDETIALLFHGLTFKIHQSTSLRLVFTPSAPRFGVASDEYMKVLRLEPLEVVASLTREWTDDIQFELWYLLEDRPDPKYNTSGLRLPERRAYSDDGRPLLPSFVLRSDFAVISKMTIADIPWSWALAVYAYIHLLKGLVGPDVGYPPALATGTELVGLDLNVTRTPQQWSQQIRVANELLYHMFIDWYKDNNDDTPDVLPERRRFGVDSSFTVWHAWMSDDDDDDAKMLDLHEEGDDTDRFLVYSPDADVVHVLQHAITQQPVSTGPFMSPVDAALMLANWPPQWDQEPFDPDWCCEIAIYIIHDTDNSLLWSKAARTPESLYQRLTTKSGPVQQTTLLDVVKHNFGETADVEFYRRHIPAGERTIQRLRDRKLRIEKQRRTAAWRRPIYPVTERDARRNRSFRERSQSPVRRTRRRGPAGKADDDDDDYKFGGGCVIL